MDLMKAWESESGSILKKQQGQGDLPASSSTTASRGVNMNANRGGRPSEKPISVESYEGDDSSPDGRDDDLKATGSYPAGENPLVKAQVELDRRFTDPFKHDPRAPKRRGRIGGKNYDPFANKWF